MGVSKLERIRRRSPQTERHHNDDSKFGDPIPPDPRRPEVIRNSWNMIRREAPKRLAELREKKDPQ